jgi:hypothetical protein
MHQAVPSSIVLGLGTWLVSLALAGDAAAEDTRGGSIEPHMKKLLAVGAKGQGNSDAAAAWQAVARADAAELPRLLRALDDASPLAANWLRAAVEAISDRTVRQGGKLPLKELEAFVRDTSHSPRARRLAYEQLARADKTAPDRLVPGMLHDPSTEFRRDAVARLLAQAQATPASDQTALLELYRRALSAARDKDQVETIAGGLKKLGQEVDLAAHFGFILNWKLIGPFDNVGGKGFAVAYPPEKEVDFEASYPGKTGTVEWSEHVTKDRYGMVNLNQAVGKHMGAAAYAAAEFHSPKQQTVQFRIASLCAVRLWLNGKLLDSREVYHAGASNEMDHYISQGTLQPGRNLILVKCLQNEQTEEWAQNWDFQLRVCDATGTAILSSHRKARE